MTTNHLKARRHSDQMYCSHCGKSWDVNDIDPPACTPVKSGHDWCDELRNKHKLEKNKR